MTFSTIKFFFTNLSYAWNDPQNCTSLILIKRSRTDANAPLIAALHLWSQNLHCLVPQRTKRRGPEQNKNTVTGPSIKGTPSGGPFKKQPKRTPGWKSRSHSQSTQLTKESTRNSELVLANMANANDDIVTEIFAEMWDSQAPSPLSPIKSPEKRTLSDSDEDTPSSEHS